MRLFYSFWKCVEIWNQQHLTHFSCGWKTYAIKCVLSWLFTCYVELTMANSNFLNNVGRWNAKTEMFTHSNQMSELRLHLPRVKPQCNWCFGLTLSVILLFEWWESLHCIATIKDSRSKFSLRETQICFMNIKCTL